MASQQQNESDRLSAIDRYANLRNWMLALVDLVEVAGQAQVEAKIEIAERTLVETAGLLRDLLEQVDSQVEVIGNLQR